MKTNKKRYQVSSLWRQFNQVKKLNLLCCQAKNYIFMEGGEFEEQESTGEEEEEEEGKSHFIEAYPFINYETEVLFLVTIFINWHKMLSREIDSDDDLSYDAFSTSESYPFVSMAAKARFILDLTNSLPPSPILDLIMSADIFKFLNTGHSKEFIVSTIIICYERLLIEKKYSINPMIDPYPADTENDFDREDYDLSKGMTRDELFDLLENEYPLERSMLYYTKADFHAKKKSLLGLKELSSTATVTWVGKTGKTYFYPTLSRGETWEASPLHRIRRGKVGQISFARAFYTKKITKGQVTFNVTNW